MDEWVPTRYLGAYLDVNDIECASVMKKAIVDN